MVLEEQLMQLEPSLLSRLPLLSAVLNLSLPDNDLTRSLDPKVRKSSLEDLLIRCLTERARVQPLLLVLEDCHWLDDLSNELIGIIGRAIADLPVLMLLVYRPPDELRKQLAPVEHLPHFREIILSEFSADEAQRLVELKLAHFFGESTAAPPALLERVTSQAAGNPFYIEELLNYLQDMDIDLQDTVALEAVDLPSSIYALVLSRIDQLDESQQLTIKVASVIGRLFQVAMLWGAYPDLDVNQVQQNLDLLSDLELTPLDTPDPELTYLFKHVITQQVAYESLLYATRAMLHEQIGRYIEGAYPDTLDQYTNLLAFHFEHSENQKKKLEYLLKAGEAAQQEYANGAAITYFEKALPLLEGRSRIDTRLKLGEVLELTGEWNEAGSQYESARAEAQGLMDREAEAWCQTALGELNRKRNEYETAADWFARAREAFEALNHDEGAGQVLHFAGTLAANQGDYVLANQCYNESLILRRERGDRKNEASVLNNLGIVARYLGNSDASRRYHEAALAIEEELGNQWTTAGYVNNLGLLAIDSHDYADAKQYFDSALRIYVEIGARWSMNNTIHNLANVARETDDFEESQKLYTKSIDGWQELNDRWGIAYWLEDMGLLHLKRNVPFSALQLMSAAARLREEISAPRPPAYQAQLDKSLAPAYAALDAAEQAEARAIGNALSLKQAIALGLN